MAGDTRVPESLQVCLDDDNAVREAFDRQLADGLSLDLVVDRVPSVHDDEPEIDVRVTNAVIEAWGRNPDAVHEIGCWKIVNEASGALAPDSKAFPFVWTLLRWDRARRLLDHDKRCREGRPTGRTAWHGKLSNRSEPQDSHVRDDLLDA